jgi:hypothetical protein
MGIQRKRNHSHHHPLVGFGGMTGQGQYMRLVVVPIQIGDLEFYLEDRRFEGHWFAMFSVAASVQDCWAILAISPEWPRYPVHFIFAMVFQ